jgi:hypothetical protein
MEDHVLQMTENLFVALEHLRYENEERVMWIDAICVGQSNIQERSHQVKRMGDIFQLATGTIAWDGAKDKNSTLALNTL